jgi:hypothetical protein
MAIAVEVILIRRIPFEPNESEDVLEGVVVLFDVALPNESGPTS